MSDTHREKKVINKLGQIIALTIFIITTSLLIKELAVTPYQSHQKIKKIQKLYQPVTQIDNSKRNEEYFDGPIENTEKPYTTKIPSKGELELDENGHLMEFTQLLEINTDVIGWISIKETNIDYPVLQSKKEDPEYYLTRNLYKEKDKCGSIFMDINSSIEVSTQNKVLHGHNMTSTNNMFHSLLEYDNLAYYLKHPVINFNTIYQKGQWKIISVFKADANITKDFFDYTKSSFENNLDFLNFVYALRTRSLFHCPVDITEEDQLLTLSTCSYELDNYRMVVVARKIREEEQETIEIEKAEKNIQPLYPASWYLNYGGTPPKTYSFLEALEAGVITWYKQQP